MLSDGSGSTNVVGGCILELRTFRLRSGIAAGELQPDSGLGVFVGTEGQPLSISVTRAAGYGLDQAAIDEVENWRWTPGMKDGKPVAAQIVVQVKFQLAKSSAKP